MTRQPHRGFPSWATALLCACYPLVMIACGGDKGSGPDGQAPDDSERLGLLPSAFERALPTMATSDPDGDGVVDRYLAVFGEEILQGGQRLVRTLGYDAEADGRFRGSIGLDFASGPSSTSPFEHVEIIPKAFAPTVDDLEFSHPPTVLEADPRVSWTITDADETDIRISATRLVETSEAAGLSGQALGEYCAARCRELEADSKDRIACVLSVAHRFPDTPSIQEFVASCRESEFMCAEVKALVSGDWQTHCGGLSDEDARGCYVEVFNTHADETCKAREGEGAAAVAECLLGYWRQIGSELGRDLVCFDPGFQAGINRRLDWSAFSAACAAEATREHCEQIGDGALRGRCVAAHARLADDISLCDELGDDPAYGARQCREEFIWFRFAGPEACASLAAESQETCRAIIAVREGDPTACLAITDPTLRNACIATAVASSDGYTDPAICDAMEREEGEFGEEERQLKHDFCVMAVAAFARDAAMCQRVEDELQRAGCTVMFALLAEEPVRACQEAPGPVFQCLCLGLAGVGRKDRAICDAISHDSARLACVREALAMGAPDNTPLEEACQELCVDADGDEYFPDLGCHTRIDCDDGDPDVFPFGTELCADHKDNDCDGNIDCRDPACATTPACVTTEPSEVVFTDHSKTFEVTLGFPDGQGSGYRFVPESELGYSVYGSGELVLIELASYPHDPAAWPLEAVPVVVSVKSPSPLRAWRVYPASNASDPASRSTTTWWENTSDPIPMRGDRFYWLYIYPEEGPYAQEVLRVEGLLE